ncbi:MAG: shikimate kinase [Coriobacteriia bacterium]|nr:shikimate kinase [Coriobacteriia bacterium]
MVDASSENKRHIALIGFMGAGKSCVARELAKRYGCDRIDLDDYIEEMAGKSVADIFQQDGEQRFRQMELDALHAALDYPATTQVKPKATIIACGGGTVTNPESLALLRQGAVIVYLAVQPERALARINDWTTRPLLTQAGSVDAVYALAQSRLALYEAASDISVNTDKRDIDEVADCVVTRLREAGYARLLA